MKIKTIVELLNYVLDSNKRPDLFNYRLNNTWKSISTDEFGITVKRLAAGLYQMGVRGGENIGIISNPSPFWVMSDFAIMLCGGVTVPVFRKISPENLKFEISDSNLNYIFIGDANEFEPVKQHGGIVKKVITIGFNAADPLGISFDEVVALGEKALEENDKLLSEFHFPDENELATVIYTSGSMGMPKGVMLTHKNLMAQVADTISVFPLYPGKDLVLTSLPLAHIFERMIMYYYIASGVPIYFVDDMNNIGALVRDVRPTVMTVVPRLLEKIYSRMKSVIEEEKGFKKIIGSAAMKRAVEKDITKPFRGFRDFLYRKLVYSKFSSALGGRFRIVVSGSAALSPDICRFFINIGLPVFEGYGLTEASPVISANLPGRMKFATVGRAFPSVKIKITDDGEILAKGPNIMTGYRNNPEETKHSLDSEGYLHTGDLGRLDEEGYLTITGRKKELMKKSTGEYVPPVPIEQALKQLDIVDEAVIIAEGRKFVSCLIFPNMEVVDRIRVKAGFDKITTEDFLDTEYIHNRIDGHIKEMNKHLHHTEEVQRYTVIKSPISVETGELTPTLKMRRYVITKKFKKEIDLMYDE